MWVNSENEQQKKDSPNEIRYETQWKTMLNKDSFSF